MAENSYNASDMMSMQRDAVRRVREMQRRANEKLRPPVPAQRDAAHPPAAPAPPASRPASESAGSGLSSFLSQMNLDSEKTMLLLLIILLLREGADTKLILALCYLLI